MINNLIELHKELLISLNNLTGVSPLIDKIIYILAQKIDNYIVILAMGLLVFFIYLSIEHTAWKRFKFLIIESVQIFTAIGIAWGFSYWLKIITHVPRPYLQYPMQIKKLFDYGGFDSFPSGHATLFMALAFMIYIHHKRLGYIFIFLAFVISIARVVAGIHSPLDIITGWLIGGGISIVVYRYIKHPKCTELFVRIGRRLSLIKKTQ